MPEGGLSYETLRAIVEHASDGVFVTDGSLRMEWVNAAACELLGRPRDELVGRRIAEFVEPDELAREPLKTDQLRAGQSTFTTRTFRRADGTTRVLEVSAKLIGDGRMLGIARDATERLRDQQRLARSEASFRALIDRNPDAIIVHRDGIVRYANEACAKLLGWPSAKWGIGKPAFDLAQPEERPSIAARIRALQAGEDIPFVEQRLRRADGSEVVALVSGMLSVFEGESSIVVTVRDISELRRMTDQLAQADRLASLGTLAAGVAHEINNPLTYVLLHLDSVATIAATLGDVTPLSARLQEHAESATEGARRVARIVRDLRAFSRTDDDRRVAIDVHGPIEIALSTASHEIKHRARIERRFENVPKVSASEGRLAQIVLNLLLNAAQAIPEGRPDDHLVTVSTTVDGEEVRIAIADTGMGISEEHRRRVFEPFFTTKQVGEGSGLGLSICHGLVTALGGRIEVDSTVGKGSTFTVVLPAFSARDLTPHPGIAAPASDRRRTRILFVDDEAAIGVALARAFEKSHEIVLATSGFAAREQLEQDTDFDVVVCDLAMPGMMGTELHAWMREHTPALARRTLFVTGGRVSEDRRALEAIEPLRLLEKPFTLDAFEAAIAEVASLVR